MQREILEESDDQIVVCVGTSQWMTADGLLILEEDFNVDGEIWRVHKYDPDPFPSNPHAHCIAGANRFVGCKLHLGTGELYDSKSNSLGRFLHRKQFDRLIELIRPKFPNIVLPLVMS